MRKIKDDYNAWAYQYDNSVIISDDEEQNKYHLITHQAPHLWGFLFEEVFSLNPQVRQNSDTYN